MNTKTGIDRLRYICKIHGIATNGTTAYSQVYNIKTGEYEVEEFKLQNCTEKKLLKWLGY